MGEKTKTRVLIVDDDPDVTAMLRLMLHVEEYDVRSAANTAQGMLAIHSDPPDVVLLDVMMPNHSGLELCRYIRREPRTMKLPVVIYSALDDEENIRQGLEAGANVYLDKTVSKEQLLNTIENVLQQASA
jgi:DNA-binding response OmpR family regulator